MAEAHDNQHRSPEDDIRREGGRDLDVVMIFTILFASALLLFGVAIPAVSALVYDTKRAVNESTMVQYKDLGEYREYRLNQELQLTQNAGIPIDQAMTDYVEYQQSLEAQVEPQQP